jgi:hypothetical protein
MDANATVADAAGDVFRPFAADSDARLNCEHATP